MPRLYQRDIQKLNSPLTCHCPTSLENARDKVNSKTCRKVKKGHFQVGALRNTGHKFDKGRSLGTRADGTRDVGQKFPLYLSEAAGVDSGSAACSAVGLYLWPIRKPYVSYLPSYPLIRLQL